MAKWDEVSIPYSVHDLQVLLGRLLWASPFIVNYKVLVAPMEKLLSRTVEPVWTQECTDALNQMVKQIHHRMSLILADMSCPFKMYVDVGEEVFSIVLT